MATLRTCCCQNVPAKGQLLSTETATIWPPPSSNPNWANNAHTQMWSRRRQDVRTMNDMTAPRGSQSRLWPFCICLGISGLDLRTMGVQCPNNLYFIWIFINLFALKTFMENPHLVNEIWTAKLLAWNGCGQEGKCGGCGKAKGEMQKGKWAVSQECPMPEDQWRVELKRWRGSG